MTEERSPQDGWLQVIGAIYHALQKIPPSSSELLAYLEQEEPVFFQETIPSLLLELPPQQALDFIEQLKVATLHYKAALQTHMGMSQKKQKINSAYLSNE